MGEVGSIDRGVMGGFVRRGWRGADGEREVWVADEVGGLRDGVGFLSCG